jgi:prophage regulatory protein
VSNLNWQDESGRVDRVVRMRDVISILRLSESHVYLLISEGRFPRPFPLIPGGRAVGWRESTIDKYIADREAESSVLRARAGGTGNGSPDRALTAESPQRNRTHQPRSLRATD